MSFPRNSSLSGLSLVGLPRMLRAGGVSLGLCVLSVFGRAQDFAELSLEELTDAEVVESSKSASRLFDVPVSAFVFDEEAIRYLPVDSVPELLRYAPGIHVMRVGNGVWGVGLRGLTSRNLSRTLFTVDDQSFGSRLHSGFFGIEHDLLMEDMAAVEVVYGPGGGLWDTNAMNGNVNVVMKSAFETEGSLFRVQMGNQLRAAAGRFGWQVNEETAARVYAKYTQRESNGAQIGSDAQHSSRAGFRLDRIVGAKGLLTASAEWGHSHHGGTREVGDLSDGEVERIQTEEEQSLISGQVRFLMQEDAENGWEVNLWAGAVETNAIFLEYEQSLVGGKLQWRRQIGERHELKVGAGVSHGAQRFQDALVGDYREDSEDRWASAHSGLEYTFRLLPDVLDWGAGYSLQYDSSDEKTVGLPFFRLLWRPWENSRFWVSYGRGIRATPLGLYDLDEAESLPYHLEGTEIPTPNGPVAIDHSFQFFSVAEDLGREELDAYEIGYRHHGLGWDVRVSAFLSRFEELFGVTRESSEIVSDVPHPYLLEAYRLDNLVQGEIYGVDLSLELELASWWRFQTNLALQGDSLEVRSLEGQNPDLNSGLGELVYGSVPSFIGSIWSHVDLAEAWRFDLGWRYNSAFDTASGRQEEVHQADARLTWQPRDGLSVSLVGRNLLSPEVDELRLSDIVVNPVPIRREWYLELRYEF